MKKIMNKLEKNLDNKNLSLSAEQTKIIELWNGGERERKENWEWKEECVEQVKHERDFRHDFKRRMFLIDVLINSVMLYGMEI